MDSQVVAKLIKNILTDAEYAKLMLKRSIFTFEDDTNGIDLIDGPCLLKLLNDCVDPNIVIGIEGLRAKLESVKLHSFGNNVDDMLTDMEENYVNIWTTTVLVNQSVGTASTYSCLVQMPSSMHLLNVSRMILIHKQV